MKLLIKQRVFAWGDTYDVYDEAGNVKYVVKAEVFAFGHQLHVCDASGNEVGKISQKLLTIMPQFEIEVRGSVRGTIKKKFTLFHPQYDIDYNGWHAEGDFWGWNYEVSSGYRSIMHVNKQLLAWGDTYIIDIAQEQDELEAMMLVIAIDAANCDNNE